MTRRASRGLAPLVLFVALAACGKYGPPVRSKNAPAAPAAVEQPAPPPAPEQPPAPEAPPAVPVPAPQSPDGSQPPGGEPQP